MSRDRKSRVPDQTPADRQKAEAPEQSAHKVGYRNPPKHSRFKPGQSGNPKGRPKGARSLDTIWIEKLSKKVAVREGNRIRRMSKHEVIIDANLNKAMRGDAKASEFVIRHGERYLAATMGAEAASSDRDLEDADRKALERFVELRAKAPKVQEEET